MINYNKIIALWRQRSLWGAFVAMCFLIACAPPAPPSEKPEPIGEQPPVVIKDEEVIDQVDVADLKEEKAEVISSPAASAPGSGAPHTVRPAHATPSDGAAGFAAVTDLDPSIFLDIRYATVNNFTNVKIYDCPQCLLRPEAAKAIAAAHADLKRMGYGGLKMFDCYRPRPYQQKLWDKVPNPDYVTPPAKGSMHSRGAAVDLTIVDGNGKAIDMGTEYDYFGEKAHYDYTNLPAEVLANRRLLRKTLEKHGFQGIRTEWWHFSYRGKTYPLSDYVWPCR